jgi:uncharacterized protein (DUF488 family)
LAEQGLYVAALDFMGRMGHPVSMGVGGRATGGRTEHGRVRIPKLFTIGYQGRSPDELVDRLHEAGVKRVVDVRELPLSRRRGFSKSRLAETLERVGISYEHVRELGNPKPYRDRYKSGDVRGGAREFRRHLHNGSHNALVELADSIDGVRTCLLCVEESHEICHRAVIAGALAERLPRVAIVHL